MDLYKICEDLINGKIKIKYVISKYKINCFRLIDFIKRYCFHYKILIDEDIKKILDAPLIEMLELRKQGISYERLSNEYNCSSSTIKNRLKKYCEENDFKIPKKTIKQESIELPMEEIYTLKKHGFSYRKIARQYECSHQLIKKRLTKYCEENSYEIPEKVVYPKLIELPIEKIYESINQGASYNDSAREYGCSAATIRKRLVEYEEELALKNKYLEILLYDFNKIQEDILNRKIGLFYEERSKDQEESIVLTKK